LGDSSFNDMLDAQNLASAKEAAPALQRLAQAGKIKFYAIGTPVRVIKSDVGRLKVEIAEGPDRGDQGWVQVEFVMP
jgi:hypothetical protein